MPFYFKGICFAKFSYYGIKLKTLQPAYAYRPVFNRAMHKKQIIGCYGHLSDKA